jgi:hypothetical protein
MPDQRTPAQKQMSLLHGQMMYALEKGNPQQAASFLRVYQKDGMSAADLAATWQEVLIDQPELPETMQEFLTQYPPKGQPEQPTTEWTPTSTTRSRKPWLTGN